MARAGRRTCSAWRWCACLLTLLSVPALHHLVVTVGQGAATSASAPPDLAAEAAAGSPTSLRGLPSPQAAPGQPLVDQGPALQGEKQRPAPGAVAATQVVVVRCTEDLAWLAQVLDRVPRPGNATLRAVLYERCEAPAEHSLTVGATKVVREVVSGTPAATKVLTNHMIQNLKWHVEGLFPLVLFIDASNEEQIRKALSKAPAPWTEWDLNAFVDALTTSAMPLAIGSGLQLVRTGAVGDQAAGRLRRFGDLLTRSSFSADAWEPRGLPRCPAAALPALRPLEPGARTAIVTYLSNQAFLVTARVLLHSLRQRGCQSDVVLATIPKSPKLPEQFQREFPDVKVVVWPYINPPPGSKEFPRWRDNYSKLNLFNMVEYDAIFYIDADIVALQNPDALFKHKVVQESLTPYIGSPDWGFWSQPPSTKSNGGVLFCRPNPALFKCMTEQLYNVPGDVWNSVEAEQGFLRWFFGDRWTQMPYTFNAQKTVKYSMPEIWDETQVALLHYVGVKPHKTWSSAEWLRTYREETVKQELAGVDQADDMKDDFEALAMRWRSSFFSLANFSNTLSMFVMYHDQESYRGVQERLEAAYDKDLFVPLSLRDPVAPNGLSTRQMMPALLDPAVQLQLGEFAGLLAMAKASWYSKPWIGFTTHSEHRKSGWREGPSIDWVAVEKIVRDPTLQHPRSVLFWYGIFAGDYWELMETHHKGMPAAIRAVLSKMGYTAQNLIMPLNTFWPFGNYMMMPYQVLKEFAAFSDAFLETFKAVYPTGCPYETMETHTANWQARCVGYATERLIHVWGMLTQVRFEFVVDDKPLRYKAGCNANPVHCIKETKDP